MHPTMNSRYLVCTLEETRVIRTPVLAKTGISEYRAGDSARPNIRLEAAFLDSADRAFSKARVLAIRAADRCQRTRNSRIQPRVMQGALFVILTVSADGATMRWIHLNVRVILDIRKCSGLSQRWNSLRGLRKIWDGSQ